MEVLNERLMDRRINRVHALGVSVVLRQDPLFEANCKDYVVTLSNKGPINNYLMKFIK